MMRRGVLRQGMLMAVVLAVICGSALAAEKGDLLEFLMKKNEEAREKIKSVSYTIEVQYQSNRDGVKNESRSVGEVKKQGICHWSIKRRLGLDGKPETGLGREERLVVNEKYLAFWPVGNPLAYQNDYTSFSMIDSRLQSTIRGVSPADDFIAYSFGSGGIWGKTFRETKKKTEEPLGSKWDAIETKNEAGETVYQIRRMFHGAQAPEKKMDMIWTIDPRKGYLATEDALLYENGETLRHRTRRVEEVAQGVWFPVAYEETNYVTKKEGQAKAEVANWSKGTLKDLKINEAIPRQQFEVDVLALQKGDPNWPANFPVILRLLRTSVSGAKIAYVYKDGKWIPDKVAQSMMPVKKKAVKK